MFRFLVLFFLIFQVTKSLRAEFNEGDKFLCTGLYEKLINYSNDGLKTQTLLFNEMNINQVTINILKNNFFEITSEYGVFKIKFIRKHYFDDYYKYFAEEKNGQVFVLSKETKDNMITHKINGHFILFSYPSIPFNSDSPIISIYKHKCIKVRRN